MGKLSALLFPRHAAKYTKSVPGSLKVGAVEINRLEALGGSQPGITKVGRLSLSGYVGEQKVKVYTAHSEKHAQLLRHIHSLNFSSCQLAPLITTEGRLIVEAWVAGEAVDNLKGGSRQQAHDQVSSFLSELATQSLHTKSLNSVRDEFCYLQNYLVERLSEWRYHREVGSFLDEWLEDYQVLQPTLEKRITHPDLSARNLIVDSSTGCVRIIDNELLGYGHGWILDWQNSLLSKSGAERLKVDTDVLRPFIEKTWRLRQLGSALDEGRFDKVGGLLLDA